MLTVFNYSNIAITEQEMPILSPSDFNEGVSGFKPSWAVMKNTFKNV